MRQVEAVSNAALFESEEFHKELMARARRQGADAEDALQTAYVKAWVVRMAREEHFEEIESLKAYVRRSTKNAFIDERRKVQKNCGWDEVNPVDLASRSDEAHLEARDLIAVIYRAACKELKDPVREVGLRWLAAFAVGEDPNASQLAEQEPGYEERSLEEQKKLRALRSLHVNRFKAWCRVRFA